MYACIRFLSSFRFIASFVKASEYICGTMMEVSSFLSFAALMKLDLTCSEKVQSENFVITGRLVP